MFPSFYVAAHESQIVFYGKMREPAALLDDQRAENAGLTLFPFDMKMFGSLQPEDDVCQNRLAYPGRANQHGNRSAINGQRLFTKKSASAELNGQFPKEFHGVAHPSSPESQQTGSRY